MSVGKGSIQRANRAKKARPAKVLKEKLPSESPIQEEAIHSKAQDRPKGVVKPITGDLPYYLL